jgi:hypothetical protein
LLQVGVYRLTSVEVKHPKKPHPIDYSYLIFKNFNFFSKKKSFISNTVAPK